MRRSILYFASWRLVIASSVFGFLEDRALLCPDFPPEPTGLGRSGGQDRGSRNAAQAGPRGAGYLGAKHGQVNGRRYHAFMCGWPPPGKRKCSVPHGSRLQSCVRPVHAVRMDCWPCWSPRTEASSLERDRCPNETVIGASSWSEWPQTIFSGQTSSSVAASYPCRAVLDARRADPRSSTNCACAAERRQRL